MSKLISLEQVLKKSKVGISWFNSLRRIYPGDMKLQRGVFVDELEADTFLKWLEKKRDVAKKAYSENGKRNGLKRKKER